MFVWACIFAVIPCAVASCVTAWAILAIIELRAMGRRYKPWQNWTITFQVKR